MNRCLAAVMVMGVFSGAATAADCTVSENEVNCAPGEVYDKALHKNKELNDYEKVTLHRTDPKTHGYAQFSNKVVFQDLSVIVEGAQSDGVTLRNWGPEVDFNNLNVHASGISGDGINLGRDNSGGRVRVHKNAVIESMQGMGVRSVASEMDDKKHIITFNGSSTIDTYSDGGGDVGHAVFAGTQSSGCGPFNIPLFDCKANGKAEIHLLGGADNLHTITTRGSSANALYASGKGQIFADNIRIETHAEQAHGIAVDRVSGRYYHGSADQGPQDYAGSIELRGNVSVTVHGPDAYAFRADSGSEQSGLDSEGNIASIRSFDSAQGKAVTDKTYLINGNMLATNSGLIDLSMGEGSQFTGTTLTEKNGVLHLQMAGQNSEWRMAGDSAVSSLALHKGASLIPNHNSASTPSSRTLKGRFVNKGGVIDLTRNGLVGDTFIVDGDYESDQGRMIFNTLLSDDNSPVDKLIITGDSSGHGIVHIADQGGVGAATANGIQLISIQGHSGANFSLAEDYVHDGEKAVVVGAYAYKLRKGKEAGVNDSHWYLLSDLKTSPGPDPDPDPDPDPEPKQPNYNAGTPINEVYPQLLLALNTLPTLQQRSGERYSSRGASAYSNSALNSAAGLAKNSSVEAIKEGPWVRVIAGHDRVRPRISTTDSTFKYDTFGMQIGLDKKLHQSESSRVFAGLSLLYGHGKANVFSAHGDGDIKTDSYGVAATLTWYGNDGVYVDAQAQRNWFESKLYSSLAQKDLAQGKNRGDGYAFSLETGKRYTINDVWSLTPQVQLQYNNVKFDTFSTQWLSSSSAVSHDKSDSLLARLGVSVNYNNDSAQGSSSNLYAIFNIYNEFSGKTKVRVADTQFVNQRERLTASVGVGGVHSWARGKYAIYGEGSLNSSFKHISDNYGYRATVGFRLLW